MTLKELEEQKKLYAEAATAQKQAIEDQTNTAIKDLKAEQESIIKDYDAEYNDIVNLANVQKHISQREVSEAMANAGMTDSGLNRTQQTAVQLSYANAENQARIARQKFVDALASKVREQLGLLESQRTADKANVDSTISEEIIKLDDKYAEQGNKKYTARNSLISTLNDGAKSDDEKIGLLNSYFDQYGSDSAFTNYAKSYYDKVYNDSASTEEAKKAAAQAYLNAVEESEYEKVMNALIEKGYEFDSKGKIIALGNDDSGGGGNPVEVVGVSTRHKNEGTNITDDMKTKLSDAFKKGGLEDYLNLANKYAIEGYNYAAMDEYMHDTFGDFWLMAIGTKDGQDAGYSRSFSAGKTDNMNLFGLDANAEYIFPAEDGTESAKTIGALRSEALAKDVKRVVMRKVLEQYGVNDTYEDDKEE